MNINKAYSDLIFLDVSKNISFKGIDLSSYIENTHAHTNTYIKMKKFAKTVHNT